MEPLQRQPKVNDLVDQIAQHLRQYPCDIRHVRKVMRSFHATAADVEQAINQIAVPVALRLDPTVVEDKVLLHFLRYPGDMIDMRRVMRHFHASEGDIQRALEKLTAFIVDGGEGVVHAGIDK